MNKKSLKEYLEDYLNEENEDGINILRDFLKEEVEDAEVERLAKYGIESAWLDQHGGEGEGEDYWTVYKFSKGHEVVFVKFQGFYYSYDGVTYDNWSFVIPKEETIIVYE